jgi:hypothetical protein
VFKFFLDFKKNKRKIKKLKTAVKMTAARFRAGRVYSSLSGRKVKKIGDKMA